MIPDRLPLSAVLGACLIAVLPAALAGLLHDSTPSPAAATTQASPALAGKAIAADVARLRDLAFHRVPPVRAITAREERRLTGRLSAKTRAKAKPGASSPRTQALERAARAGLEWARLVGFVDPGFKIKAAASALGGSVVGEYQPSQRRILVQSSPADPPHYEDVIAAHELDHALDAQHFPAIFHIHETPANSERAAAAAAVVEGTATVIADRFAREHGYPQVGPGRQLYSIDNLGFGVPAGLAAEFRFPYTAGADFVRRLRRQGGWPLVDRAFRHPPTSTAQVLDPRRWLHGDSYRRVVVRAALGNGWRLIGKADSGALDAQVLLSLALPVNAAVNSTVGWDGGGIATWRRPAPSVCRAPCRSAAASVVAYRWTTAVHAAKFTGALPAYLEARLRARPLGGLVWRVRGGFAAIDQRDRGTALALAPTETLAGRLARAGVGAAIRPK